MCPYIYDTKESFRRVNTGRRLSNCPLDSIQLGVVRDNLGLPLLH